MSFVFSPYLAAISFFLIGALLFWLVNKFPKEVKYYLIVPAFYYIGLAHFAILVGLQYAFTAPFKCAYILNDTEEIVFSTTHGSHVVANHTDVLYNYVNSCASVSTTSLENLYIIFIANIGVIGFCLLLYLLYSFYLLVRDLF